MFESFKKHFSIDAAGNTSGMSTGMPGGSDVSDPVISTFLSNFGGQSFNGGIYRTFSADDSRKWNKEVEGAFPGYKGRIFCFGFDWLGRIFAIDSERKESGDSAVSMFEPGTAEVLELPCTLRSFHDEEIVEYSDAALAADFYQQWRKAGGVAPRHDQCVGYKKPLFLGGSDLIENLQMGDMDVYWTLMAQLIEKTRGLPTGTKVKSITLE